MKRGAFWYALVLMMSWPAGAEDLLVELQWQREGLAAQVAKFQRVSFTKHPSEEGLTVANCERDASWWGDLQVVKHAGDKVEWVAKWPASYEESKGCYVLSCEWRYLEKARLWVLEVFDSTHMGNGSLWLFALEGREMRVLLHTKARGGYWREDLRVPLNGEARFKQPHADVEYRRGEGDNGEAVHLKGTVLVTDISGADAGSFAYEEVWRWNAEKKAFNKE